MVVENKRDRQKNGDTTLERHTHTQTRRCARAFWFLCTDSASSTVASRSVAIYKDIPHFLENTYFQITLFLIIFQNPLGFLYRFSRSHTLAEHSAIFFVQLQLLINLLS